MGLYRNESFKLSDTCFERKAVQKFNEYAHTFVGNPFGNFFDNMFPMGAMTVNLLYMIFSQCGFDDSVNAMATYCWYRGCWPMQILYKSGKKFLYIFRAINDAAIVWVEGMRKSPKIEDWRKISQGTGKAAAGIL